MLRALVCPACELQQQLEMFELWSASNPKLHATATAVNNADTCSGLLQANWVSRSKAVGSCTSLSVLDQLKDQELTPTHMPQETPQSCPWRSDMELSAVGASGQGGALLNCWTAGAGWPGCSACCWSSLKAQLAPAS